MRDVILRLSEETAKDLWSLLYMHGEHTAAGAPIVPMPDDSSERLGRVFRSLCGQLERGDRYFGPAPSPDTML